MKRVNIQGTASRSSYWNIFRLIFVIFSLYLLKDAFFRWDGFSYHSTFLEFLPGFGLTTIFWSIIAAFVSLVTWLLLRGAEWCFRKSEWNVTAEFFVMFIGVFTILAVIAWISKRILTGDTLSITIKISILIFLSSTSALLSWRFRTKTDKLQERITPLVWLFGFWLACSLPLVVYHTWVKQADDVRTEKPAYSYAETSDRPNIILFIFDALAARDMSAFGYDRPTTPYINEWAKSASLFTRVESSSNWTTPAMASLMTGKRVWTHRTFHAYSYSSKREVENLPLLLKNAGYYNMAFVANSYAAPEKLGVADSFDVSPSFLDFVKPRHLIGWKFGYLEVWLTKVFGGKIKLFSWIITPDFILGKIIRKIVFSFSVINKTEGPPESVFDKFFNEIETGVQHPFFAWIHLYPPHDPYLPDLPYSGMFDSSSKLRTYNQQMDELTWKKVKREENWGIFRSRYNEFIRYCDKKFETFITELKKRSLLDNTIIIFTSDHGESFEHGYFTHGDDHLYEQVTHVPLIISSPLQSEGQIVHDLIEQIDITPSILGLANIPKPDWMEGRSLTPLLNGTKLEPKQAFSMNFEKNPGLGSQIKNGSIAVWEGDYKLVHYLRNEKSLLFNLAQDPDEIDNLFDVEKETGSRLLRLINDKLSKANEKISAGN